VFVTCFFSVRVFGQTVREKLWAKSVLFTTNVSAVNIKMINQQALQQRGNSTKVNDGQRPINVYRVL